MKARTMYGQLMATTSIVLAAVLVLSVAAYFVTNALYAHNDTRRRMQFELPTIAAVVRHYGAARAAPTIRDAAYGLHGGVALYSAQGHLLVRAGTPAPAAYMRKVLEDIDVVPGHFVFHETRTTRSDTLVALYPVYRAGGALILVALNAPVLPSPPSFREVGPILVAELLALLLAQLLWSLVIRRFTRPLEAIAEWAGRLAAGDLHARMETTEGVAELRHLSEALHSMADALAAEHDRREEFLEEVAHDLRTPLSVQRTVLMALSRPDAGASADVPRLARQAQAETERLIRLVNGLLDLARLEAGSTLTTAEVLDLREPVAMAAASFEVYARQRAVDLAVDLGDRAIPVVADADRVTQIATNLIDNAVRHAGRGGRVAIETRFNEGALQARLAVTDSGPGIPPVLRTSMWRRFSSASPGRRGTRGLGLAISQGLARAMGGDLVLEDGGPTRFVLSLPAHTRPA